MQAGQVASAEGRRARRFVLGLLVLSLAGAMGAGAAFPGPMPPSQVPLAGPRAARLANLFDELGYRLEAIRRGEASVPRLFLASLPRDMDTLPSADTRKRLFIRALLPLVLAANEAIWAKRERLLDLVARKRAGLPLNWAERVWLADLAAEHGVAAGDDARLVRRLDVVPPALALAQAAAESGWGTSRFAHHGNALFGQRTWSAGAGLVPERREADLRHEVKRFDGLEDAVRAYIKNLNCHPAYRDFRARRAEMRERGAELDSAALASSLHRYAEAGADYIDTLRSIMRVNRLAELDSARLENERAPFGG